MRVTMVATTVPRSADDATPRFVVDLARGLASEHEVAVLAPAVTGAPPISWFGPVAVHRFRFFFRRFENLADEAIVPTLRSRPWTWLQVAPLVMATVWALWRHARTTHPTVIIAHWVFPAGIAAWVCRKTLRIPYVVTAHGADVYTLDNTLFRLFKRVILDGAAAVMPVAQHIDDALHQIAPSAQFGPVTPMGARAVDTPPKDRIRSRLLFVGRLADKKGADVLLRALALVDGASLVMCGDGPERISLEQLATRLGIADRVHFEGAVDAERVSDEMRKCGTLVIPSVVAADGDREGSPVVLAEGLAHLIPVIASDLPGIREWIDVGVNGVLFEPGSPKSLATALAESLNGEELGPGGSTRALESFRESPLSLESTIAAYERVLDEVWRG